MIGHVTDALLNTLITDTAASSDIPSITVGTGDATGGENGDLHIQVDVSDAVIALWHKATGTWTEYSIAAGGGGSTTSGTADPTGGSPSDVYLQVDTSDALIAIWLNISNTWTEYGR